MVSSRFARLLTLALAAIQLAAPAVASIAEGAFSRRVVDPRSHIESQAQTDCVPTHASDCVVCRYLVDNVGYVAPAPMLVAIVMAEPEPVVSASLGATADRQGFEARGPPAITG